MGAKIIFAGVVLITAGVALIIAGIALVDAWVLWSEGTAATDTRGWTIIRQLANDRDLTTTVVQVEPEFSKERSVYDAAVRTCAFFERTGTFALSVSSYPAITFQTPALSWVAGS